MLAAYREVLHPPGTVRLVGLSLLARLPTGMYAVLLLVLLERETGSYAAGGLVAGLVAVGIGVASPVRGRALDRFGASSLVVLSAANAGATVALALLAAPGRLPLLATLGLLHGATSPQVIAAMRLEWRRLFGAGTSQLATAFTLDISLHITAFFIGPLLATGGIVLVGPRATLVASAALTITTGAAFAAQTKAPRLEAGHHSTGWGSIALPPVRRLVLIVVFADIPLGVVDVSAVAAAAERGHPDLAGVLLAAFTAGSALGAAAYGARGWATPPLKRLMVLLGCHAAALASLAFETPLLLFVALLFVAGAPSAAQWATSSVVLDAATPESGAEPFTWLSSANAAGIAFGGVMAGLLIDAHGTRSAFVLAAGAAAVALALTLLSTRALNPAS